MHYPTIAAIVAAGSCFTLAAENIKEKLEPIIFAVKADKKMVIDGKDTEACYAKAKPTADFRTMFDDEVEAASQVRTAFDDERYYFFYDCFETENAAPLQIDDSVELFIGSSNGKEDFYYQIYANLDGDMIVNRKLTAVTDPEIIGKIDVKFSRKGKGFCCEIAVSRDIFPDKDVLLRRVNFNRTRRRNDIPKSFTGWSITGGDFHTPARFGYLFTGEQDDFVRYYYGRTAKLQMEKFKSSISKYSDRISAAVLKKLDDEYAAFEKSMQKTPSIDSGAKILLLIKNTREKIISELFSSIGREFGNDIRPETMLTIFSNPEKESVDQKWEKNIRDNRIYTVSKAGDKFFTPYLPENFFEKIAAGEFNRNFYPPYSDRKAWAKARKNKYADIIIAKADAISDKELPQLLFSEYRRFITDGNRTGFQKVYFRRRHDLAMLAMALCLTGDKDKYMPRLLNYTVAILEEFSWCVPAHARWLSYRGQLLDSHPADLFSSETGAMMALLHHLLGAELDKYFANISERIRQTTLKRTVYNVLYHPDSSFMHWWYKKDSPSNWTVWCSYNNMIVALLLEKDTEKTAEYVKRFLQLHAHYAYLFPEDGYCDEGPSYFCKAGLMHFAMLNLMQRILPGSMDKIFRIPKVRAIFEYIFKVGIGKNHVVNYGDNLPEISRDIDIAICGDVIGSDILKSLIPYDKFVFGESASTLSDCLKIIFEIPEKSENKPALPPFSCFKDRLAIIRSAGFSTAVKAGHNAEEHNHNDLGHITVYYKNKPVIVDAGRDNYSADNFSDRRYSLWYNRGSGHNAPCFGDIEQLAGAKYTAKFKQADRTNITVDLSRAYPAKAEVKRFTRAVDFSENKLTVTDDFKLGSPKTAHLRFITPCEVKKISGNTLLLDDVQMSFEGAELKSLSAAKSNLYWQSKLTVIELKSGQNNYKITFTAAK